MWEGDGDRMQDYENILKQFLPPTATILELQQPKRQAAILLADIDGDQVEELIGAYKIQEENYILILKKRNQQWQSFTHIKGSGYGISDFLVAPITNNRTNTLIVGWQIGSVWSKLDLLEWKKSELVRLPTNNIVYSKLEVEDMPSSHGEDGIAEIAFWKHDTDEAYKVSIYRFGGDRPIRAKDVYPYYFKKVGAYYQELLRTNELPIYWFYLADAQEKADMFDQALVSIDQSLIIPPSYPFKKKILEKRNQIVDHLGKKRLNTPVIVDSKRGDVKGNGYIETVYLTAEKTEGSPFWKNITLVILNERTNLYEKFHLNENEGYHPTLFLGDFTGNHVDDILIVIDTGGSGGTIYAYVFSFINGKMKQVFDADAFNDRYKYEVNYQDQYQVNVISLTPKKKYRLDLKYKGKEYLSEIYNQDGSLKGPIQGWVDPLGGLYPIDFARDGTYELTAFQQIAGRYHADGLGNMENVLKWNGHEFIPNRQSVSIFGQDLTTT